jgi:hypothetical protein
MQLDACGPLTRVGVSPRGPHGWASAAKARSDSEMAPQFIVIPSEIAKVTIAGQEID